jgi:hypothetical protein
MVFILATRGSGVAGATRHRNPGDCPTLTGMNRLLGQSAGVPQNVGARSRGVAVVPSDTRHRFRNVADSDSTLEFVVMPGGEIDDYFRRLTALFAAGETDTAALNALGAEYGSIIAPPLTD